jgi:hypothetical protein
MVPAARGSNVVGAGATYSAAKMERCLHRMHITYATPTTVADLHQTFGSTALGEMDVGSGGGINISGATLVFEENAGLAKRNAGRLAHQVIYLTLVNPFNTSSPFEGGLAKPSNALIESLTQVVGNVVILWSYPPAPAAASKRLVGQCLGSSQIYPR